MSNDPRILWVVIAIPALPFLMRSILWFYYPLAMRTELASEARDEESHRSASLAIAGFSLTIFVGLAMVDAAMKIDLETVLYFSGMSFVMFMATFFAQNNKETLLADQFADAAMDAGTLCLMLSVVSLVLGRPSLQAPGLVLIGATTLTWFLNYLRRLSLSRGYLAALETRIVYEQAKERQSQAAP